MAFVVATTLRNYVLKSEPEHVCPATNIFHCFFQRNSPKCLSIVMIEITVGAHYWKLLRSPSDSQMVGCDPKVGRVVTDLFSVGCGPVPGKNIKSNACCAFISKGSFCSSVIYSQSVPVGGSNAL